MTRSEIAGRLLGILSSKEQMSLQIDIAAVRDDTSLLKDLALDSIQLLELIVAIENQFQIQVSNEDLSIDVFDRFSLLVDFVEARLAVAAQS